MTDLTEVMAIMTSSRIRHVPVMDGDKLMGIVSIGDVVKQISKDQEVHIRTLEEYINDPYPGPSQNVAGGGAGNFCDFSRPRGLLPEAACCSFLVGARAAIHPPS